MKQSFKLALSFIVLFSCLLNIAKSQCVTCNNATSASIGTSNSFSSTMINNSFIAGRNSLISNNNSAIIGSYSTNRGMYSYITGYYSTIDVACNSSYILGEYCRVANTYSMLIGYNLKTSTSNSFAIGYGNIGLGNELTTTVPYSLIVGFKSKFPTLYVGPTSTNYESGRVGIGNVTDPLAKLHIKADTIEDASLLLETSGTNRSAALVLKGSKNFISSSSRISPLTFLTGGENTRMVITAETGKIGIGDFSATEPEGKVHIKANDYEDATLIIESSANSKISGLFFKNAPGNIATIDENQPINFYTGSTTLRMKIDPNGNVGIGTSNPTKTLHVVGSSLFSGNMYMSQSNIYVDGEIKAKKFMAVPDPWADEVFEKDYNLLKIEELEQYIKINRHLPDVPSASEVQDNGIELGETTSILLRKIEELTLYIIQQQKEINELKMGKNE